MNVEFWLAVILALRTMVYVSCFAVAIVYAPAFYQALREVFDPRANAVERDRLEERLRILGTPDDMPRKVTVAALLGGMFLLVSMFIMTGTEALINGWGLGATTLTNSLPVRVIFHVGILTALSVKLIPTAQSRLGRYGYLAWCSIMAVGVVSLTVFQFVV